jgi:hypothetical protein
VKLSFRIKLLNLLAILLIALTVLTFIMLPFIVTKYSMLTGMQLQNSQFLLAFLYFTAVPFTILLFMIKKLCKNILSYDPFCKSSINALNVISICAFVDFLLYAAGTLILLRNLLSLTLMIAAFMIGLTSLVLSQLVGTAMEIKRENDLTI